MRFCTVLAIALLAAGSAASAQDLNVCEFRRVVDVNQRTYVDRLPWYAGESVGYTIIARRDGAVVQIPAGSVPVWIVQASTGAPPRVVSTGTVVSATNGEVRFWLPAPQGNLPAGDYLSYATVYRGTNEIGVLDRAIVRVSWRPGDDFEAVPPLTNVIDQIIGWWADANGIMAGVSNAIHAEIVAEAGLRAAGDAAGLAESGQVQTNLVNATNDLHAAVTNEAALRAAGDAAGLAAYGQVQTNLVAASNALHAAVTNEAALRAAGDAAGLAAYGQVQTNLVNATNDLHAAVTNEAALRAAGDASNAASIVALGVEATNISESVAGAMCIMKTNRAPDDTIVSEFGPDGVRFMYWWNGSTVAGINFEDGIIVSDDRSIDYVGGVLSGDFAYRGNSTFQSTSGSTNRVSFDGVDVNFSSANSISGLPESISSSAATSIAQAVVEAAADRGEVIPPALALADGYVTIWSTNGVEQMYNAAGVATVRLVKVNSAAWARHALSICLTNHATYFATNNIPGFTTNGLYYNGTTNVVFVDSLPNSTNWTWKLLR